ncbi:unnamed protein product [Arctogadus glacialis]
MALQSTWVCIGELELAILNLQRNETIVAKVYDLLHLVWKTYRQSPQSRRELNLIGEELGEKKGVCQLTVVSIQLFCATWTTLPPQQPVLKFKGVQRRLVLQKNNLILPQAISALRKTVMVLQAMQETPQRGGMLCQFMECLQGQEEISFQVRASVVEWEKAMESLQQAWSSFTYFSEGGTVNVGGPGLRLKKALA